MARVCVDMGDMEAKGIAPERIRTYGFAFCGKQVLIRPGMSEKP